MLDYNIAEGARSPWEDILLPPECETTQTYMRKTFVSMSKSKFISCALA